MMFALRFWQLVSIGLLPAVALVLTACGEGTGRPLSSLDVLVSDSTDNTLHTLNTADTPNVQFWRTDFPFGNAEQQVPPPASVMLADGTTMTLESLAGGRPMLLYFYSTW